MTARPFRFAVQGGPFHDAVALREHARLVESLGYDELFTSDHIGVFDTEEARYQVDPFLPLVVAAESTTSLRLGPLVINNEFHVPSLLARAAITFDQLTAGRLVLGMGTGYAAGELEAIGRSILRPAQRVDRFTESLSIIRSLLDTGAAHHDGTHESAHIDKIGARPVQPRVPMLIGGHGPRMVRLGAQFADIFQFTGLTHEAGTGTPSGGGFAFEQVAERAAWLTDAAGGRNDDIERSVLVQFTAIGDNAPSPEVLAPRFELDSSVVERSPFVLSGSLEQVIDKLKRLRETLGTSHIVIRDPEGFAPVVDALRGR